MAPSSAHTFGDLLQQHRLAAGLTQEELAERAGLSVRGVGYLERGIRRAPRKDTVTRLATALTLTANDLALLNEAARRHRVPVPAVSRALAPVADSVGTRSIGNLPVLLTPILGREHEEATALHLLRQQDVRLLTLTGAPGIGKTRLALQIGAGLDRDAPDSGFADGVFLVELAPISDPTLVLPTIVHTLGVREAGGELTSPLAALVALLRARRLLLLLDNFEQVVAAGPQVVALLQACAGLKVLATSRIPLQVRGEHRLAVPPLALPDSAALLPAEELAQYPAIALFLQRAQEVRPTFALTPAQAPAVAAICRQLDGLPLAIELAAAWTRVLSPSALLARLTQRQPLLAAGTRDMPERQQTLRSAIDWSYDLLSPAQQVLLRRLAVFVSGWTLEAAEVVCGEVGQSEAVLPALATLVDVSLVEHQEEAAGGETRFRLLEMVREYAHERLEASGDGDVVRERHARYYLGLAQQAGRGLAGPEMETWLARLSRDYGNLQATYEWAKQLDVAAGLRMAVAMVDYWGASGHVSMGRQWLEELLELDARAGQVAPAILRAFALNAAGILAYRLDDVMHATVRVREALERARGLGQKRLTANALNMLGNLARTQGYHARARALYEEALAVRQEMAHDLDAAVASSKVGRLTQADLEVLWREQGIVATVEEVGGAATALADLSYWNQQSTSALMGNLAKLVLAAGDYQRSGELFEEVRSRFAALGRNLNEAHMRVQLGQVAFRQGDLERARGLLEVVLPALRQAGDKECVARSLYWLGRVAHGQSNPARAVALHRESLALHQELEDREGIAMNLEGLGIAVSAAGQVEPAVRLIGKAATLREQIAAPLSPTDRLIVDRLTGELRTVLGEEQFAALTEQACTTPLEHLLAVCVQ